jgi:hypothetical protein
MQPEQGYINQDKLALLLYTAPHPRRHSSRNLCPTSEHTYEEGINMDPAKGK